MHRHDTRNIGRLRAFAVLAVLAVSAMGTAAPAWSATADDAANPTAEETAETVSPAGWTWIAGWTWLRSGPVDITDGLEPGDGGAVALGWTWL